MSPPQIESVELSDGYRVSVRWWLPPRPRGAVLYLHGIQSHGGWFETSAGLLAAAGRAVLLPDRRGSGLNQTARGHTPTLGRLVRDVSELRALLVARTGCRRARLVAVSWGAKLAAAIHSRTPDRVAGIDLVCPGFFPRVGVPATQKLRIAWAALWNRPTRFDIPLSDPELFTANPRRLAFLRADSLALHQATGRLLAASRWLDHAVRRWSTTQIDVPVRCFLAGQDRIIDPTLTADYARRLHGDRVQILTYPDAHHTLEFEPDPRPFFDDLLAGVAD